MVKSYKENVKLEFNGCVVDIESIGDFNNGYSDFDSRKYSAIQPIVFGLLTNKELKIYYATKKEEIPSLLNHIMKIIDTLDQPFYGFQTNFERAVLFHNIGKEIEFRELNKFTHENKENAVRELKIRDYNDPFKKGKDCIEAWKRGDIANIIKHNRACLLKERDILLKRGYRNPDRLRFIKVKSLRDRGKKGKTGEKKTIEHYKKLGYNCIKVNNWIYTCIIYEMRIDKAIDSVEGWFWLTTEERKKRIEELREIKRITKEIRNTMNKEQLSWLSKTPYKPNGFPDLMVWNKNEIFFVEVKSYSSYLNKNQVEFFKELSKFFDVYISNFDAKKIVIKKYDYEKDKWGYRIKRESRAESLTSFLTKHMIL